MRKNPYLLFKNSYPTFLGTFVQTSFMFALYDYLNETFCFVHESLEMPRQPWKILFCGVSSILAMTFSYPFLGPVRDMIETAPKQLS